MTAAFPPFPISVPGLGSRSDTHPVWKPIPAGHGPTPKATLPPLAVVPNWQAATVPAFAGFPTSWAAPLTALPTPSAPEVAFAPISAGIPAPDPIRPSTSVGVPAAGVEKPDFTDDDMREAFGPIVEHAVRNAVYAKENGMDTYLEPMLRATIRRALAEYSPASRPFHAPGALDRMVWQFQALFSSRTYEEVLFEKTHRFQVEEVFLVDAASLALVSFASCDPARHSSAKRVNHTIQRLTMQLRGEDGKIRDSFELPDQRNVISRVGGFVILMAVVRGEANALILADLEFSLRRIEDRFREQFQEHGSAMLHTLQPFLEDCLLIQAPASAA